MKNFIKQLYFTFLLVIVSQGLFAQQSANYFKFAKENVVLKSASLIEIQSNRMYYPAGYNGKQLVYQLNIRSKNGDGLSSEAAVKLYYDEINKEVIDTVFIKREGKDVLNFFQADKTTLYHGFYQISPNCQNKTIDE